VQVRTPGPFEGIAVSTAPTAFWRSPKRMGSYVKRPTGVMTDSDGRVELTQPRAELFWGGTSPEPANRVQLSGGSLTWQSEKKWQTRKTPRRLS